MSTVAALTESRELGPENSNFFVDSADTAIGIQSIQKNLSVHFGSLDISLGSLLYCLMMSLLSQHFKIPEVRLELGLAELRLEYFRDHFRWRRPESGLSASLRQSPPFWPIGSPLLEVGSESSKNVTDFGDEGPDIDILS